MATAHHAGQSPELGEVLEHAAPIRAAVAAAGGSNPRVIGAAVRGGTTAGHVTLLISDQPKLSLLKLVNLEAELAAMLRLNVDVWTEEAFRPEERARYLAEAMSL